MTTRELIKTDRNGTKTFKVTEKCAKCNGTGFVEYFKFYENGVCFDCGGTGAHVYNDKEYTPEYEAKLMARRQVKEAARAANYAAEHTAFVARVAAKHADENGVSYYVLGDTYGRRAQIKEDGGLFENTNGWHFARRVEGYDLQEVKFADVFDNEISGQFQRFEKIVNTPPRRFYGAIGEKINITVKGAGLFFYTRTKYFGFGQSETVSIYKFTDDENHVFVWNTATGYVEDFEVGKTYQLRATIKGHSEYQEEKQTEIIRVKTESEAEK